VKRLDDRVRKRLDERLEAAKPASRFAPPLKGWIRAIRDAIGMSGPQLARRLGVTPQNVEQVEKSEVTGTIQLSTLRRFAEALDATVVYALVPNTSLEDIVRTRARQLALKALGRVSHTMRLEDQATGTSDLEALVDEYIRDHLNDRDLWSEV
jgi:predicted DNA-binding mobile mystery protein A